MYLLIRSIVLILVFSFTSFCKPQDSHSLKIMTYNIRVDIPNQGVNSWENRKGLVVELIKEADPDIIGIQEALKSQIEYLIINLPQYNWVGVAREDGIEKGEYTAIIYKKERFIILTDSTFWLSENSGKPSIGWDAAYSRTVTYAKIKDTFSSSIFYLYNTHFDHIGEEARFKSAKLILNNINRTVKSKPIILIGDFNCTINSEPYRVIISDKINVLTNSKNISAKVPEGSLGTFTGFDITVKPKAPIDFIFVGNNISVKNHITIDKTIDNKLPSDHFPVMVEVVIN